LPQQESEKFAGVHIRGEYWWMLQLLKWHGCGLMICWFLQISHGWKKNHRMISCYVEVFMRTPPRYLPHINGALKHWNSPHQRRPKTLGLPQDLAPPSIQQFKHHFSLLSPHQGHKIAIIYQ
jgi:hypothetical protein